MKQLKKHSENIYLVMLGLSIPFYFMTYGASGHSFRLEPEYTTGMFVILFAIFVAIFYLIRQRFKVEIITIIKILFGLTLFVALYGGIRVFWFIINFNFGYDADFFIIALSYLMPAAFIFSIINLGYWLVKDQPD